MKIWTPISLWSLDLYCIHQTPASLALNVRPHHRGRVRHTPNPHARCPHPTLHRCDTCPAADPGCASCAQGTPPARCGTLRLSPHWPGILDDLFADTKTLRSPPQALANAMNHLTDTDTTIDRQRERDTGRCASALWTHPRQSHHCPLRPANAPYGFGTSSTLHRALVLATPCRRHTTNATNAPYGTPTPPTAAAPPPPLPPP